MTASHDQRVTPGRRMVRQRLADAPGCEDWNAAIRKAREDYYARPSTRWCEFLLIDDGEPCCEPAAPPFSHYCRRHRSALRRAK